MSDFFEKYPNAKPMIHAFDGAQFLAHHKKAALRYSALKKVSLEQVHADGTRIQLDSSGEPIVIEEEITEETTEGTTQDTPRDEETTTTEE